MLSRDNKRDQLRDQPSLAFNHIAFHTHSLPTLKAGKYSIEVHHQMDWDEQAIEPAQQSFYVHGPRFSLPAEDIHSIFPPNHSKGLFARNLPHITFNKRILPWERSLINKEPAVPWLALLMFTESELHREEDTPLNGITINPVEKLYQNDPEVLNPPELACRAIQDREGEKAQCQTIEISPELFKCIFPRQKELPFLSHCRQVNTEDKEVQDSLDDGWYSVVMANRFPISDGSSSNIVHLISLEGWQSCLTENGIPADLLTGRKRLRLVSLANWQFDALPPRGRGETFAELASHLARPDTLPNDLLLRFPLVGDDDDSIPQKRLRAGYVPLTYHTAPGVHTFAWYRGPLTPVPTETLSKQRPYRNVSDAMIYSDSTGLFDLSLATAWQLGRSLALADNDFAIQILNFRRKGHHIIDSLMARITSLGLDAGGNLADIAGKDVFTEAISHLFSAGLVDKISQSASDAGLQSTTPRDSRSSTSFNDIQQMTAFFQQENVKVLLEESLAEELESIGQWCAKRELLYHVPFHHLVPDPQMLPPESLRFFYLDRNYLDALRDGVISIGVQSSRDTVYNLVLRSAIDRATEQATKSMRDKLRGITSVAAAHVADHEPMTGVLLRTSLVSGWPGLSVRGKMSEGDAESNLLKILRMERLGDDVLLCIFEGTPQIVTISEPQEGLNFGVTPRGELEIRELLNPAEIGKNTTEKLKIYQPSGPATAYLRNKGRERVLQIIKDQNNSEAMIPSLAAKTGITGKFDAAHFAIQMVQLPQKIEFYRNLEQGVTL